eukprot:1143247-Pelagomonas_calceolata.AAC.2
MALSQCTGSWCNHAPHAAAPSVAPISSPLCCANEVYVAGHNGATTKDVEEHGGLCLHEVCVTGRNGNFTVWPALFLAALLTRVRGSTGLALDAAEGMHSPFTRSYHA